jgi:hypothetical protein
MGAYLVHTVLVVVIDTWVVWAGDDAREIGIRSSTGGRLTWHITVYTFVTLLADTGIVAIVTI